MKSIDEVERLLARAAMDQAAKPAYLRALRRQVLWFPVAHHPELPNPWEPSLSDDIPFWIGEDEEGTFIPIFSSPKIMRLDMCRFEQRHSRARMPGAQLLAALQRTGQAVKVNPGAKFSGRILADGVAELAAGETATCEPGEEVVAAMDILLPHMWPEEWRDRLHREAEARGGVIAIWLGRAQKGNATVSAGAIYLLVWVADETHTNVDGIRLAARLAFPGQEIEVIVMDEKNSGDSLAQLKKHPVIFPRA